MTKDFLINVNGSDVILRWSNRRHTIGLSVTAEGKLVIAAPRGVSEETIARVVEKKKTWVERNIAERKEALALLPDGVVFFRGKAYHLIATLDGKEPVELGRDTIHIGAQEETKVWLMLRSWYQQEAKRVLSERVRHYADQLGLEVKQVEVRGWKSRWGECRPTGILRFNWRLVLLLPEVLDYVVVHELVHLWEPGHTPRFWQFLVAVLPGNASRRSWLKQYGPPFLFWRPRPLAQDITSA